MRVMGVEFNASEMRYVVIESDGNTKTVVASNRLELGSTRSPSALKAFQSALLSTLDSTAPDRIAVKLKPELGKMRAGAAALKMEGILLANSRCDVEFVSGARINKTTDVANALHAYSQAAFKAAVAALK